MTLWDAVAYTYGKHVAVWYKVLLLHKIVSKNFQQSASTQTYALPYAESAGQFQDRNLYFI